MNLLLVTFSLRNPFKDYSQFYVALRGNSLQWMTFIEHTYVVTTTHTANDFARLLYPHMERTDSILVVKVTPFDFQGWLPKEAWDWLHNASQQQSPAGLLNP